MNDYSFGNRLLQLRKESGLTQRQAAASLKVTDKAVSKWETGRAKPALGIVRNLANLYHVSVDELLKLLEERQEPKITKIVLTGGPCAGKTTAMSWIQNAFTKDGYTVLFVPETATELISGGVRPGDCRSGLDFQAGLMRLQLAKEKVFTDLARSLKAEKVLIVCDRGALDNRAYLDDAGFLALLHEIGMSEVELRDGYDAVFHLVTAAKGAVDCYTTANNKARSETPEQAAALDDAVIRAWTGHPHLRIIDNSTEFEAKMLRLISEIAAFLGEPEPYEIERKYLIEYPDLHALAEDPNCRRVEIIQTYLTPPPGTDDEIRVRQRGENGSYLYYQTTKRTISGLKRVETERRLSQQEYLTLLMQADPERRPIRKDRYCLTYEGQYFEIDVYPFWKDQAIAEIELRTGDEEITFPPQIKVIREVTDDEAYKNASLAKR